MSKEKLIVHKYDRFRACAGLLTDGFVIDYLCPKCKRSLNSKCELLDVGDACPNCEAAYDFDEEIKKSYSAFQATIALEKKLDDEKRQQEVAAREMQLQKRRMRQREQERKEREEAQAELERIEWSRIGKNRFASESYLDVRVHAAWGRLDILIQGTRWCIVILFLVSVVIMIASGSNWELFYSGAAIFWSCIPALISLEIFGFLVNVAVSLPYLLFRILEELTVRNSNH